ncbi:hypothetical protein [Geosporobacter ferrireducens]|uniref:Uncharacterized protein n=1 Tax=Geosporobacter ferrireducens TaxID=1424294 RepID=A0A1D8GFN2_9FIRM|nr:hypothetical protein [Geosporobacter ferrireducens]AOT69722.1 hypothetical protein Gferi_09085 [Geosporobacter ferrireducens]MTI54569.1 hypothetical protein [Geosporobacter ferrireducens]
MKGEKAAVGIIVIATVIVLGGAVGIFGGYYLSNRASAESIRTVAEDASIQADSASQEDAVENAVTPDMEEAIAEEPFSIPEIHNVEVFMETWGTLIEKSCRGSISPKEASKMVYQLASEGYRRNIPEGYGPLRIKGISDQGLGSFEAIQFSKPILDGEELALIDITEMYSNGNNSYRLKLVKENNKWYFAAQFSQ